MKKYITLLFIATSINAGFSQNLSTEKEYTRHDTLRGSVTKERAWWDLLKYDLTIAVNPETRYIKGSNIIQYMVLENYNVLQIDLQSPLRIENAYQDGNVLEISQDSSAHFIKLNKKQIPGEINELKIEFSGNPHVAKRPPWSGGFQWSKDENGNHFIATSCQGIGASIWWPCKDHMYDEPDNGMIIHANVPEDLMAVANGRLIEEKKEKNKTKTYTWQVVNPINNYGVNLNIGDYVHFSEKYEGEKGILDMDYWVIKLNLEKARVQFKDAARMMEAFEHWFGPYPFYEDGYKLVEVPYPGMEHQSSVTYGNGYKNGFGGRDVSRTGWGDKFDFIIIHESGHEWFANSITYKDIADMWIHESFTAYSEGLFVEYFYGKDAGSEYIRGTRSNIGNTRSIIGTYDVNASGSGDMYSKGSNMLHTLRQIVNDDEKWRSMLRDLNKEFYHQTVTTNQIEEYMAKSLNLDLDAFFDQYLRDYRVPVLEYRIDGDKLAYRWTNCIKGFDMPLKINIVGEDMIIMPNTNFKFKEIKGGEISIRIDPDFYIYSNNIMGGY